MLTRWLAQHSTLARDWDRWSYLRISGASLQVVAPHPEVVILTAVFDSWFVVWAPVMRGWLKVCRLWSWLIVSAASKDAARDS